MRILIMASLIVLATTAGASTTENRDAFSQPAKHLPASQQLDFRVGRGFFRRLWVTAPASTQAADGLGPLYNARSCMACHPNNGRGFAPRSDDESALSLVLKIDIPAQDAQQRERLQQRIISNIPDPTYGLQLQNFAIAGHAAESRISVSYEAMHIQLRDNIDLTLRKPRYQAQNLGYGPLHPQARLSPRVAPQLIGMGLLESIPESAIIANADPNDRNGDGISGRVNQVWSREHQQLMLGRFGHKAGMSTVNEQSQSALFIDLGISTPLFTDGAGDCTAFQVKCRRAPDGSTPHYDNLEVHQPVTDLIELYVSHLAVPARRNVDSPMVQAGERLFMAIGCGGCHTPHYDSAHNSRSIAPYTDLLLHDMGEGLADNRPEAQANGREWRTAPLWGIGLTEIVSGYASYLHDGRARTLLEAIMWHGGEAQHQREAVANLSAKERQQLLSFIESL